MGNVPVEPAEKKKESTYGLPDSVVFVRPSTFSENVFHPGDSLVTLRSYDLLDFNARVPGCEEGCYINPIFFPAIAKRLSGSNNAGVFIRSRILERPKTLKAVMGETVQAIKQYESEYPLIQHFPVIIPCIVKIHDDAHAILIVLNVTPIKWGKETGNAIIVNSYDPWGSGELMSCSSYVTDIKNEIKWILIDAGWHASVIPESNRPGIQRQERCMEELWSKDEHKYLGGYCATYCMIMAVLCCHFSNSKPSQFDEDLMAIYLGQMGPGVADIDALLRKGFINLGWVVSNSVAQLKIKTVGDEYPARCCLVPDGSGGEKWVSV